MALDISSYHSSLQLPSQTQGLIDNCFNDIKWLSAFEKFSGLDNEACHQLMTSNGVPAGFLPAYIENESMCGTLRDRVLGRFARLPIFMNWGIRNAIACSSPWGFFSGIECSEKDRSTVCEALIKHIDQIAYERKLGLSGFTFVPETSHELRKQLEDHGYKSIPVGPTTFLELKWNSFDEYLESRPSGKFRTSIRSERKKAKRLNFEWYEEDNLNMIVGGRPLYSIMMELYRNTQTKHSHDKSILNSSFLPNLWEMDKKNLRLCIARLDRKIVAFGLLRLSGTIAHALMTGRDYDVKDSFYSYFNTCYYEPIIRGIKEKWSVIYFRPGVYRAKLRRGCQLEKLYLYIKGHSLSSQIFLNLYIPVAKKYFNHKFSMPNLINQ
jgi:predicted N-acyltransferase